MCAAGRLFRIAAAIAFSLVAISTALAQPSEPRCRIRVHVAKSEDGVTRWDAPAWSMKTWLSDASRRNADGVCYAREPERADVVIVWQEFTVRTAYYGHSAPPVSIGAMLDASNLGGGHLPSHYTFATNSLSIADLGAPAARSERGVLVTSFVRRPVSPLAIALPASVTWRVGRWPWSKPDKEALAAAIGRVAADPDYGRR